MDGLASAAKDADMESVERKLGRASNNVSGAARSVRSSLGEGSGTSCQIHGNLDYAALERD